MVINLISGPRNISTALMYSFSQRTDTKVVDEPFYAHYLDKTGIEHPGRAETLSTMAIDPKEILNSIDQLSSEFEVVFLKNMAHHHVSLDWSYMDEMKNIFLIRNPKQLIASFAQVIPNPTMLDIGLELEVEILEYVQSKGHSEPIVIDSNNILGNPKLGLSKLCTQLDIPFDDKMLSWKKGPIEEDGAWAKYWYKNVHQSTGFSKQPTSDRTLPPQCIELYQEAMPLYEKLSSHLN